MSHNVEEGEEEWHDVVEGEGNEIQKEATLSVHALERSQGVDIIRMVGQKSMTIKQVSFHWVPYHQNG